MYWDFPGVSDGKASAYNAGDPGSIPGLGRSPGEGNGNPLQYSCLDNPMDGGAWQATVHGVAKSRTPLSDFTFTFKWYYKIIFPKSYLPLTLWKITSFIPKMKFLFKNSENLSSWLVFCLLIIRLFKIQVLRGLLMHAD